MSDNAPKVESSPAFLKAAEDVQKLKKTPSMGEKGELYGLFKVGRGEEVKNGGMFDPVQKGKFAAWNKLIEAGVTPEEAQKKYVAFVEQLKEKYGFDA